METVILKHYYLNKYFMIGKRRINLIKSLANKKIRKKEQLFLVEGDKNVFEVLLSYINVKELIATEDFLLQNKGNVSGTETITAVTGNDIKKASLLKSPQRALALCHLPPAIPLPDKLPDISFYLDGIQDPGNLGTLLRICDWFGMEYLFCSPDTADIFNPKVIQSSMGSFCRIKTVYISYEDILNLASQSKIPVFGTFMEGESLYSLELPAQMLIVMGNEGNGIRPDVAKKTDNKLHIPSFGIGQRGAESLNVAVAGGIIASEFRRQNKAHLLIQNGNSG